MSDTPSDSTSHRSLRIGMVCPYGWDIPGGVQIHIRELAEHFMAQGHYVSVIAPVSDEDSITDPWLIREEISKTQRVIAQHHCAQ